MRVKNLIAAGLLACCLTLSACGGAADAPEITRAATQPSQEAQTESKAQGESEPTLGSVVVAPEFVFAYEGVSLKAGEVFDASVLPEADSQYQVPSCAIEGMDNVYNYGGFELTAFDNGTEERIYSILLLDANLATQEGLALGDSVSKMEECYGTDCTREGTAYIYAGNGMNLYIIAQNDTVVSIEYRMA